MMIQQTISQQCFQCWEKRELFVYPAMFPHLPEHLASKYVKLYACVPMILDSNGPIINAIQVHEPQAETDSLRLFWFWPNVCSQYIDNIHN